MPKPVAGFNANPQNINRKGAPKRKWTWAGLLEEVGEEIEPKSKKKFKDLVSKKLWIKAVNGDIVATKEILNRMDGMPKQATEIEGEIHFTIDSSFKQLNE